METKVYTVLGAIDPETLGVTTMHEHVLADISLLTAQLQGYKQKIPKDSLTLQGTNLAALRQGMAMFSDDCSLKDDVEYAVKEMEAFRQTGGNTVVDASPIGMRAPVSQLQEAARRSGMNLVSCSGIYYADARPEEYIGRDEKFMYQLFCREMQEGIDGSGVKPGFLKCAVQTVESGGLNRSELDALRAQARVSAETGISVHVHTGYALTDEQLGQLVETAVNECGMKPDRLLMLHMDQFLRRGCENSVYITQPDTGRNVDTAYLEKLLERGVNVSFDTWGTFVSTLPDDYDRLKGLAALLKKGYGGQIVCGQDSATKAVGKTAGGTAWTWK